MMEKLSYDEFKKASAAGMMTGSACACMGPRDDEEFCPCRMRLLNMLTEEGSVKLAEDWRERQRQHDIIREKRLKRMQELGLK